MIETSLRTLLLAQASITDIVGSTGVWVVNAEQPASLPYIVITALNHDAMGALDGTGSSLRSTTFDVDCYADRYITAKNLAAAVSQFLKDYTGAAGSDTIRAVYWNDETDQRITPTDGSDAGIYVTNLDFDIHWS